MRQYKFRAWDGEKMHYNIVPWQWDFVISRAWHRCEKSTGSGLFGSGGNTGEFLVPGIRFEEIMQYADQKDRNKKDIYDGDLVKFYYWSTYEQRSFPENVDFRETELKEGIGLVYWNEEELAWYVRPSKDCKKYTGNDALSPLDEIPLVYIGASSEAIDEWLATNDGDDEILKYKDCDGISVIGNRFDNPELLNPPKEGVLNMTTDPKQPAEEVKAPTTETEQEQTPQGEAQESAEEEG